MLAHVRRSALLVCSLAALLLPGHRISAQTPQRIRGSIDDQRIVRVQHSTHPFAIPTNETSRVEAGKNLSRMILLLSPSEESKAALQQLLDAQQNPHSPQYHHWLTPAEFGARFGAADADIQKISEWLTSKGFTVDAVAHGKNFLQFSGVASQVEDAFRTELHYYHADNKQFLANSTDIALPEQIASVASGLVSLNNFGLRPPQHHNLGTAGRNAQGQKTVLTPELTATGAPNIYYLAPGDFAAIYNTKPLLTAGNDGSGISIAVTAQSNIELTDVQQFRQIFGLKTNDPNILFSGPDPGITSPIDVQEAMLDVEWAGAIAPGATIDLVIAGTTATSNGVDLAAAYAIDNAIAPIVTYTYGGCEQLLGPTGNAFYQSLWQQAAAQGVTVLVATGDNGAAGCDNANGGTPAVQGAAVNGAASTPYNVAVGGTQFADTGKESTYWSAANASDLSSALGYIPEAVWNSSCDPGQTAIATNCAFGNTNFSLLASGGGASTVYTPKPSWQTGTGVPADNARDIPDVALAASSGHDEYVYCFSLFGTPCQINGANGVSGLTIVGGTSASTPAMAGILALVEQKNGAYQGQINYVLYKLAQSNSCNSSTQINPTAQNSCIFYDVTSGNNTVPCAGGTSGCSSQTPGANGLLSGATASAGYDLATGLGSVNAANLANNWKSITFLGSQTTLNAAVLSAVHGTPLTLTGTVAPATGAGTPTGTVAFQTNTNGNPTDVLALTAGTFSGAVSDLPGGQYSLTAHYAGDGTYGASDSAPLTFSITPEPSTTQLTINATPSLGPIPYGAYLKLIINVAGTSGAGVASGNITLQDGAATVGVYPLASNGSVTVPSGAGTPFAFAPGAHALTAAYSGDNSFTASTSAQVPINVVKGTPFVILGGNSPNISAGEPLGVHAVVSGSGTALATGTIQFTDNGTAIGPTIPLQTVGFFGTQAQAATLLPNLPQGIHKIGATYDGSADPNYNSVASGDPQNEATFTATVGGSGGAATTTTLSATKLPVNLGDTATFAVSVKPTTATGTVTLWDGVGPRTAATPIGGGSVSISFPWTQAGSTALYAVYSGDATNASSTSSTVPFAVKQGIPTVAVSAAASAEPSQQVSVNVSVTGNPTNTALVYPTGVIEILDSLNGAPAQLLTVQNLTAGAGNISVYATRLKFAAGTHTLHSHYRGDLNWQAADSPTATVSVSDFSLLIAPNPLAFAAGTVGTATATITPTSNFSGAITFTCPAGNTSLPTGYTCSMTTVNVSGAATTTQLALNPPAAANAIAMTTPQVSTSQGGLKPPLQNQRALSLTLFAGSALFLFAAWAFGSKPAALRQVAMASVCAIFVGSIVLGCGGGGGGGGGGVGGGTNPVASTTAITTSNARAAVGQPLQISATVSSSVTPSGTVQFFDNGVAIGPPQTLAGGTATLQTSALSIGVHSLKAVYNSSTSTVLGSSSSATTEMVLGTVTFQVTAASAGGVTHSTTMSVTLN